MNTEEANVTHPYVQDNAVDELGPPPPPLTPAPTTWRGPASTSESILRLRQTLRQQPGVSLAASAAEISTPASTATASGSNQVIDPISSKMEEDSQVNLGHIYHQCREARLAAQKAQVTFVSGTGEGVSYTANTVQLLPVGSLEAGGPEILKTFHGSRNVGSTDGISQTMSSSFDPANLSCLMCSREHGILVPGKPSVVCISDQNFPSNLSGNEKNCFAVVRIEDASLAELGNLYLELFDKVNLPEGSVVLIGSASHLSRVGASSYAYDWVELLNRLSHRTKDLNICPLIPIVASGASGSLSRDIGQLATWFASVYQSCTRGLSDAWAALVRTCDCHSRGGGPYRQSGGYKTSHALWVARQQAKDSILSV